MVHGTIGAALAAGQETQRAGYGDLGLHRLLVFAVDEYGMMSRDAQTLLRECITEDQGGPVAGRGGPPFYVGV